MFVLVLWNFAYNLPSVMHQTEHWPHFYAIGGHFAFNFQIIFFF